MSRPLLGTPYSVATLHIPTFSVRYITPRTENMHYYMYYDPATRRLTDRRQSSDG